MRIIIFLSRFTFICNIAFLFFVFFRWLEMQKHVKAGNGNVIAVPFVENVIVVLGFSAIIINLLMNIFYVFILLSGKINLLPKWIVVVNFIFLILQFLYFFL